MKIAIDARWIFPEISGIGAYTKELIRNLAVLDRRNEYLLLFSSEAMLTRTVAELNLGAASGFKPVLAGSGIFSPLGQLVLPGKLRREGVDVFHSTNYMIPLRAFPREKPGRIKCVTTIHDVIPLIFPSHAPRSRKARFFRLYRWLMREVGKRSDAIITDSRASASDIIKRLAIPDDQKQKVRAIYLGVSERFKPAAQPGPARPASLLYVGRLDPYKNVCGLIRIFSRVREQLSFPVRLTIAGPPDARYPEAPLLAKKLGLDNDIAWSGYVDDNALVRLYQESGVLLHPSEYEGFGLQVLEAMACGLPVVCSNAGSLPEVAGNAAIMHEFSDIDGFASSVCRVLTDDNLARQLKDKGLQRAGTFSWKNLAVETLHVYEEVHALKASD